MYHTLRVAAASRHSIFPHPSLHPHLSPLPSPSPPSPSPACSLSPSHPFFLPKFAARRKQPRDRRAAIRDQTPARTSANAPPACAPGIRHARRRRRSSGWRGRLPVFHGPAASRHDACAQCGGRGWTASRALQEFFGRQFRGSMMKRVGVQRDGERKGKAWSDSECEPPKRGS